MNFLEARGQVAMPDTVCIGTTHLYQVNDATVNSFYTWKINDLTQSATGNSITVKWATPGTFLVTVVEHGAGGCDGEMRSGYVYVNAPPVPNAGPDAVVCFGTPGQLNGSGGTVYHWSPSLN